MKKLSSCQLISFIAPFLLLLSCSDNGNSNNTRLDASPDASLDTKPDTSPDSVPTIPDLSHAGPCAKAIALELKNGEAVLNGEILDEDIDNDVQLKASDCLGKESKGADRLYSILLQGNKKYRIAVDPGPSFDVALYIFTDCNNPASSCVMGADLNVMGHEEQLMLEVTSTATYYIVVDSALPPEEALSFGTYTLKIEAAKEVLNDTCVKAAALPEGTIVDDSNTYATETTNLSLSGCTGTVTPGGDMFYQVDVTAGTTYKVTVVPDSGFDVNVYVFSDCADPEGSCVAGQDAVYTGFTEELFFKAPTTGKLYVAVDSQYGIGESYSHGPFQLSIDALFVPSNDTCVNAKTLTFVAGLVDEVGDSSAAANDVTLPATGCTGTATEGFDLFYKVDLAASHQYTINLYSIDFDEAIYLFSSCGDVAGTCGPNMGADISDVIDEDIVYIPPQSGTYYIGVDTRTPNAGGVFNLSIKDKPLVANDTCTQAQVLTLVSGKVTVSGTTKQATNTATINGATCVPYFTPGPELFYSITLTANQTYTITLSPEAVFEPTLYVFSDCSDPEGTCPSGWGSDNPGSGVQEIVTITPTTTGTYYIAVDSFNIMAAGTFDLEVKEGT